MRTLALLSLLLGLSSFGLAAHAEGNCPPGYYPIGGPSAQGCAPIPGYGGGQQAPQAPPEQWADRYGAVTTDSSKAVLGVSTNMASQQAAEHAAKRDCQAKGGTNCRPEIWYANGCTAMVVGDGGYNIGKAATATEANQLGMTVCNKAGRTNCYVYYSACSLPVRVQ